MLPSQFEQLKKDYPEVWRAFTELGDRCHHAGPLDDKTRRLIKLALAIGAGHEGAAHSAVRNALATGVKPEELRHVALLAVTTLGFPAGMRARTWIADQAETKG